MTSQLGAFVAQYDVVVFDCDGVLLDTNVAKNRAFAAVAERAGFGKDACGRFADWQLSNFGISRFRAFEELLSGRFGDPVSSSTALSVSALADEFASEAAKIYSAAKETEGLRDVLEALSGLRLFVASGSAQEELREALTARGLRQCFVEVYGSPSSKIEILERIKLAELRARVLMIGDAAADAEAADSVGADFVFMSQYSTAKTAMRERSAARGYVVIDTLIDLLAPTHAFPERKDR